MTTALLLAPMAVVFVVGSLVYFALTVASDHGSHSAGELPRITRKSYRGTRRAPSMATRLMAQAALYSVLFLV